MVSAWREIVESRSEAVNISTPFAPWRWGRRQSHPSPGILRGNRGHSRLSCLLILEASLVIGFLTTKPSNARSYAIARLNPCLPAEGYMPSRGFECSRCAAIVLQVTSGNSATHQKRNGGQTIPSRYFGWQPVILIAALVAMTKSQSTYLLDAM